MEVFDDKLFEDFKLRLNSEESIVEFMEKSGCDVSEHRGNFYKCPFHTDKTPSMSVNDKKGVFKCFSCGRGGKYFDFVYQYNKIILGYKKSPREFANFLIQKDKRIRKKYNIESLEKKVEFSDKTIQYMLEVKKLANNNRRKLAKNILTENSKDELSKRLELEKKIKNIRDIDEVMLLFSEIQKGKIEID